MIGANCSDFMARRFGHRRWLAALLAVGYAWAALGGSIPLAPEPTADERSTDASTNYPCRDHRCGCRSAEHCWRACCCMSRGEKLAWAAKNGVTPPAWLVQQGVAEVSMNDQRVASSCCAQPPLVRSCCQKSRNPTPQPTATKATTTSVSLLDAQKCRGDVSGWAGLAWAMVDMPPAQLLGDSPVVKPCPCASSPAPSSPAFAPPVPPPRAA